MTKPLSLYQQLLERGTLEVSGDDYIRLHGWCQRNGAKIKSRKHNEKPWIKIVDMVKPATLVKKPTRQEFVAMVEKIEQLKQEVGYWRGLAEKDE